MIYLDHCATTPLDPRVGEAMEEARSAWGNPSSVHGAGRRARAVINEARAKIALRIGASPAEIVFTGSASEANNLALKGLALRAMSQPIKIVVSAIEHESVLNPARYLEGRFDSVEIVGVNPDANGIVQPGAIEEACQGGAQLISVMAVNNETGMIQPVESIARIAKWHNALFHVDAVQAAGRFPVDVRALGCDLLTLSAHKIGGPKGIGLLYARNGVKLDALVHGGHQEKERRAGTESPELIAGFARAFEIAWDEMEFENANRKRIEQAFLARLSENRIAFQVNGAPADKVPGVLSLSIRGVASTDIVVGMDLAGFAISAGSACSSGVIEASHVLQAMRLEPWRIESGIRISFGRENTTDQARAAADALNTLCKRLNEREALQTER